MQWGLLVVLSRYVRTQLLHAVYWQLSESHVMGAKTDRLNFSQQMGQFAIVYDYLP